MVWLEANTGLANTYRKIINASGADADWQGDILVQNNTVILPGSINSLIFDFELKKVYPNIIDIPERQGEIYKIGDKKLLTNIFNLLLYIFGKWGAIQGISVEHGYVKIDALLKQILREFNAEAFYSESSIRFTIKGISVVFEDIILAAIQKLNEDEKAELERLEKEAAEEGPQGLWHEMKWKATKAGFNKKEISDKKIAAGRLGSNFYMVSYTCPGCGSNLHMTVYQNGKETVIDTEEGKVYMARVYMCPACAKFYTPRPGRLLSEGDIYILDFEEDTRAAEDYKKLIGRKGKKTSNSNFNMYETEYMDKVHNGNRSLAKICSRINVLTDEELERLIWQMEEGFFSDAEIKRFMEYVEQELEFRKNAQLDTYTKFRKGLKSGKIGDEGVAGTESHRADYSLLDDKDEEDSGDDRLDEIIKNYMGGGSKENSAESNAGKGTDKEDNAENNINPENNAEDNIRNTTDKVSGSSMDKKKSLFKFNKKNKNNTSPGDITKNNTSKSIAESTKDMEEEDTDNQKDSNIIEKVTDNNENPDNKKGINNNRDTSNKENGNKEDTKVKGTENTVITKEIIVKKIKEGKSKKYKDIQNIIKEVENSSLDNEDKEIFIQQLHEMLEQSGKKELNYLISHLPQNDSKERYKRVKERIKSYKDIDTKKYEEIADKFIENAERAELSSIVRKARAGDRQSILDIMESIKNKDFDPGILKEYNDELYRQLKEIDTETVRRICPDINALDVKEGIRAMREIEAADILQEIKTDMAALIDKKLTRMKTEESEQLVEKLRRSIDDKIQDSSRIHYYSAGKMLQGENTDDEALLIRKAISRYAVLLERYEYPVMICDASILGNGKDGFIITPDHIFYKGMVKSGKIDIMDIEDITLKKGKAGKSVCVDKKSGKKIKLPCPLKGKDQENMALALDNFTNYLKTKPKSRSVEYMAQEKHITICCYRCGHVFKSGNICPKCGSRN